MTTMTALWLPILLSAVIVFIASAIIHMAPLWHRNECPQVPDQDRLMDALRSFGLKPGEYMVPRAASMKDCKTPEFTEKMKRGPVLLMTVLPNEPMSMARPLVQWFIYTLIIGVFAAYVTSRTLAVDAAYLEVFRVAGTTAFIAYSVGLWQQSIWYSRPWKTTALHTLDGVIYALLTGGVFGVALARVTIEFKAQLLPQYLRLDCAGTFTQQSMLAAYTQAFALAAEQGREAVLIDARNVTGREPTMGERYDQAVHVADAQQKQSPRIRLAVLGNEPLIHPERFGEIVATNRGAQVKVFTDEDLALDWLLSRPKTP